MEDTTYHLSLTRGRLLARNMVLNLLGYGAPLLVALFAIPIMIRYLGTQRFGILTLAWVIIGYLSLLDLGLGRALTKLVAEKLGAGRVAEVPALIWTALFIMIMLGVLIAICFVVLTPILVTRLLKIPPELRAETILTLYLLAAGMPVVILGVGFRGVLEAHQRFDLVNAVRVPMGIYSFCAPLIVLPFSNNLFHVVLILIGGKLIGCMVQLLLCLKLVPALKKGFALQRTNVSSLFQFGSWMTITNIISPLLVYVDRFFISALISVTAVAYYATPSEIVTKLLLISGSLMGVLFPAFSTSFHVDPKRSEKMFFRGIKYIFLIIFPISLLIITFANEGLQMWLGDEFAANSTRVLQWIAAGVLALSMGQVPYAMIQGAGRPDLTAKLHLAELVLYLPILFYFASKYDIEGVAVAWVLRVSADVLCMQYFAKKLLKSNNRHLKQEAVIGLTVSIILFFAASLDRFRNKNRISGVGSCTYLFSVWFYFLAPDEKGFILAKLTRTNLEKARHP